MAAAIDWHDGLDETSAGPPWDSRPAAIRKDEMEKKHCVGCHDDYYNCGTVETTGAANCWLLKKAKLIWRKEVSVDQSPPWEQKAKLLPDCYRKPGYVYFGPKTEGW